MGKIYIAEDKCKGCALCVAACPKGIVSLSDSAINLKGYRPAQVTDMEKCIGCASCAIMCPDCVITVEREAK